MSSPPSKSPSVSPTIRALQSKFELEPIPLSPTRSPRIQPISPISVSPDECPKRDSVKSIREKYEVLTASINNLKVCPSPKSCSTPRSPGTPKVAGTPKSSTQFSSAEASKLAGDSKQQHPPPMATLTLSDVADKKQHTTPRSQPAASSSSSSAHPSTEKTAEKTPGKKEEGKGKASDEATKELVNTVLRIRAAEIHFEDMVGDDTQDDVLEAAAAGTKDGSSVYKKRRRRESLVRLRTLFRGEVEKNNKAIDELLKSIPISEPVLGNILPARTRRAVLTLSPAALHYEAQSTIPSIPSPSPASTSSPAHPPSTAPLAHRTHRASDVLTVSASPTPATDAGANGTQQPAETDESKESKEMPPPHPRKQRMPTKPRKARNPDAPCTQAAEPDPDDAWGEGKVEKSPEQLKMEEEMKKMPGDFSEVETTVAKAVSVLTNANNSWSLHVLAMIRIGEIVHRFEDTVHMPSWPASLATLQPIIAKQLADLRSTTVRETCRLLIVIGGRMGQGFRDFFASVLSVLLSRLYTTIKVISGSCHQCIQALLASTKAVNVIAQLIAPEVLRDKHAVVRRRCAEYLQILVESFPTEPEVQTQLGAIADAIKLIVMDKDKEARLSGRLAFIALEERFPELGKKLYADVDSVNQKAIDQTKKMKQDQLEVRRASIKYV